MEFRMEWGEHPSLLYTTYTLLIISEDIKVVNHFWLESMYYIVIII